MEILVINACTQDSEKCLEYAPKQSLPIGSASAGNTIKATPHKRCCRALLGTLLCDGRMCTKRRGTSAQLTLSNPFDSKRKAACGIRCVCWVRRAACSPAASDATQDPLSSLLISLLTARQNPTVPHPPAFPPLCDLLWDGKPRASRKLAATPTSALVALRPLPASSGLRPAACGLGSRVSRVKVLNYGVEAFGDWTKSRSDVEVVLTGTSNSKYSYLLCV